MKNKAYNDYKELIAQLNVDKIFILQISVYGKEMDKEIW